jgi:7,8-dihydropterin-6-yl-methyl-4-(beta-D-ribofuranosyl)aminobenzene 5'-phosphate synthase
LRLTVLAENSVPLSFGLIGEHGWSILIEDEDRSEGSGGSILFDTGQGIGVLGNARFLGKDLKKVNTIILSHGHFDHTGGLAGVLSACGGAEVFCHPAAFEKKLAKRKIADREFTVPIGMRWSQEDLSDMGARFHFITEPTEIRPGLLITGEIPEHCPFEKIEPMFFVQEKEGLRPDGIPDDLALIIKGKEGPCVILGCAHRGIINTLNLTRELLGTDNVESFFGGTHLLSRSEHDLQKTFEALETFNLKRIGPSHCTGLSVCAKLFALYPEKFIWMNVGASIEVA